MVKIVRLASNNLRRQSIPPHSTLPSMTNPPCRGIIYLVKRNEAHKLPLLQQFKGGIRYEDDVRIRKQSSEKAQRRQRVLARQRRGRLPLRGGPRRRAVVPEYDYRQVSETIRQIDEKIVKIKHAINLANLTSTVRIKFEYDDAQPVEKEMTVDQLLIRMAQLSRRKIFLDGLRKRDPKVRINSGLYPSRKTAPNTGISTTIWTRSKKTTTASTGNWPPCRSPSTGITRHMNLQ